jgi:hypothetical protein
MAGGLDARANESMGRVVRCGGAGRGPWSHSDAAEYISLAILHTRIHEVLRV